jgi:hypothetical protein
MTYTIHSAEQRSPEWFQARAGLLTGSCARDATSFLKNGNETAARRDYKLQLVCERLTGRPQESGFVNEAMQRGIDKEGDARVAYEAATGHLVTEVGFIQLDDHPAGCSLDGFVGTEHILELKCPKTATHLGYLMDPNIPKAYIPQITHNLWVTGAKGCDFVSFDDRLPEGMQLHILRVAREALDIASYEQAALAFLKDVDDELARIREQFAEALASIPVL